MSSKRKVLFALSAAGLALAVGAAGACARVQVGQDPKPEIVKDPAGKVVVLVQDSDGEPVGHVAVSIRTENGERAPVLGEYLPSSTDELGRYETWLPPGRYLVSALDEAGIETERASVEILENKETYVQLLFRVPVAELTRENPTPIDD